MLTIDRIVSLRDYEDFAANFAGIGKATATWTWDGVVRGVALSVAGVGGALIEQASPLLTNLTAAVVAAGDRRVPLVVRPASIGRFAVKATLVLDPAFLADVVVAAARSALLDHFSFARRAFGQIVSLSEVAEVLHAVRGVTGVVIARLHRTDEPEFEELGPHRPRLVPASRRPTSGPRCWSSIPTRRSSTWRWFEMRVDALYDLLPAVHRQRDEEQGGPLRQLLDVLNDELAVTADGIDQLYDDLFAETAAHWVLPYLAELIGLRGLPSGSGTGITPRAEVANTIGYRRRKGTAAVLEQVARDVTGWPTRAVEFFELIAASQNVNHVRPANLAYAPIRDAARIGLVGSPFERLTGQVDLTHTVDVRRIRSRRGRYNIGNVGLFSWRLRAYPLTASPAVPARPVSCTASTCIRSGCRRRCSRCRSPRTRSPTWPSRSTCRDRPARAGGCRYPSPRAKPEPEPAWGSGRCGRHLRPVGHRRWRGRDVGAHPAGRRPGRCRPGARPGGVRRRPDRAAG